MNCCRFGLRYRPPTSLLVLFTTSLTLLWLSHTAPAQQAAEKSPPPRSTADKRPLTHNDYDIWSTIQAPMISPDGRFVAYNLSGPGASSELIVREWRTGIEYRVSGGKAGGKAGAGAAGAKGGKGGKGGGAAAGGGG